VLINGNKKLPSISGDQCSSLSATSAPLREIVLPLLDYTFFYRNVFSPLFIVREIGSPIADLLDEHAAPF
jgi:hypothetical protein